MKEREGASPNDELFLFWTEDLLNGEWTPHPKNPIVADGRTSRPAGAILTVDGKIFRPSQDSSICLGHAVNLNQIVELDKNRYHEARVSYIEAKWDRQIRRVHTYGYANGLSVVDSYMSRTLRRSRDEDIACPLACDYAAISSNENQAPRVK
jgi:hypothetical protein